MSFLTDDFLLHGTAARELYHTFAAGQPILDYHCHLPVRDLATDRRFDNLFDIWLEGDHYKWRAMRANGVAERYCTGDAPPYEKFLAWARTVPRTLRNPLYHWTHLELQRYFDIDDVLNERTAADVWSRANRRLADGDLTAQGILRRFRVAAVCTTDDPVDPLTHHAALAASPLDTAVYPTFRPDAALRVGPTRSPPPRTSRSRGCRIFSTRCAGVTMISTRSAAASPIMDSTSARTRRAPPPRRRASSIAYAPGPTRIRWRRIDLPVTCCCFSARSTRSAAGPSSSISARCATPTPGCGRPSAATPASTRWETGRRCRGSPPIWTRSTANRRSRK
jgi:hypothetical protein